VLIQRLITILFSVMLPVQSHPEPPSDFDFRFRYGVCSTDELDPFTGWFTHELPGGAFAMAQLSLKADQRRHLYETVTRIDFFNYPSAFGWEPGKPTIFREGVIKYQLDVRSDGRMHSVQWDDDGADQGPQADRLRKLFGWAVVFIQDAAKESHLPMSPEPCSKN